MVELLEELKQAGVLEEQEQEKLDEEIRKLAEDTSKAPLTHEKWETVDSLREQMQMRLDASTRSLDKALAAIESLESAEFDAQGEPVNLDQQYSEQLLEDIRNALKAKSLDELPPSLQELVRREQQQQSGKTDAKSGGKGEQNTDGTDKGHGKKSSSTVEQFGLPRDSAERQQALQELKEFLQQESRRLEKLQQQAQRNPGGT